MEKNDIRTAIFMPKELKDRIKKIAEHRRRDMISQLETWVEREEKEAAAE